ncbi:uncharacterized protein LOC111129499 isoform X2 [Crassostrea virginica]
MSERNPADDEDSGYSKNQTESLPTSGSVPDLSGTETSAHSSEKIKTLDKDQHDSKNVEMQKESNNDLDASIVTGSLPLSMTSPPSSKTALSPLATSTPIKSKPSYEKEKSSTESMDDKSQGAGASLQSSKVNTFKEGNSSTKAAKSIKPKLPKASRWTALRKQESPKSSRGSLWTHIVNSSIINIHDTGSDVDGPPKPKPKPVAKALWKFNRPDSSEDSDSGAEKESREKVSDDTSQKEKVRETQEKEKADANVPSEKEQAREAAEGELTRVKKPKPSDGDQLLSTEMIDHGRSEPEPVIPDKEDISPLSSTEQPKSSDSARIQSTEEIDRIRAEPKPVFPDKEDSSSAPSTEQSKSQDSMGVQSTELIDQARTETKPIPPDKIGSSSTANTEQPNSLEGAGEQSTEQKDQGRSETGSDLPDKEDRRSLHEHVINATSIETGRKPGTASFETDDYTYMALGTSSASLVKASLLPGTSDVSRSTGQKQSNEGSISDQDMEDSAVSNLEGNEEHSRKDKQKSSLKEEEYPAKENEGLSLDEKEYPSEANKEYPAEENDGLSRDEKEYSSKANKEYPAEENDGFSRDEKEYSSKANKEYPAEENDGFSRDEKEYSLKANKEYPAEVNDGFSRDEKEYSSEANKEYPAEENDGFSRDEKEYSSEVNKEYPAEENDGFSRDEKEYSSKANKEYPAEENDGFSRDEKEYSLKANKEYPAEENDGFSRDEKEYSSEANKEYPAEENDGFSRDEKEYSSEVNKEYPAEENDGFSRDEKEYPSETNKEFPSNKDIQKSLKETKSYQLQEENQNLGKESFLKEEEQQLKQEEACSQKVEKYSLKKDEKDQRVEGQEVFFDLNQIDSHSIPFEVPEALKNYIDPLCTEWQDPDSRKMIYKLAVQKYYSDIGTKFERVDACLLKPSKKQLKSTYSRRDSLKGGPVPGDLLKNMLKQKAAVELANHHHSFIEEPWKKNTLETGYMKRETVSENVGLSQDISNKDFSKKKTHKEKETAEFSHRTPGYGAYSFHNISNLVIPEMEEDEANIAIASRRKSDLDFSQPMKPSKLALEYPFGRNYKSLTSLNKKMTKSSFKKRYTDNVEKPESVADKYKKDSPEQEFHGKSIPSDLLKTTEKHKYPEDGSDKTEVEIASTPCSKPVMFEDHKKDDGPETQERIKPASIVQPSEQTSTTQPVQQAYQHSSATQPTQQAYQHSSTTQPTQQAYQHSSATQPTQQAYQHSSATQPTQQAYQHSSATQSTQQAYQHSSTTQPTQQAYQHSSATQPTQQAYQHSSATQPTQQASQQPYQEGKRKRSMLDIQKEGYGEVDFNSPTLVLENLEISPDVELEGRETEHSESKRSTNVSLAQKEGTPSLVLDECLRKDGENRIHVTSENADLENKEDTKTYIAVDDSTKSSAGNPEIEAIKSMLQRKLDEQSLLLQKQSLLSAVILQSLQKGSIQQEDLNTLVSLHKAGEIDLEKSTPKNIVMLPPKEKLTQTKAKETPPKEKVVNSPIGCKKMARAEGPKSKDYSLPSEVLKRRLEKEIQGKVTEGRHYRAEGPESSVDRAESPESSVDRGYESGADTSFRADMDSKQKQHNFEEESASRRFCFSSSDRDTEDSRDVRDLIEILNPSVPCNSSISDEELSIMTPSSSSFHKSYSDKKLHGSSKYSSSNIDDYNEEILSYYKHDDSDSRSLKKMSSQDDNIFEMGSNMQLCNFPKEPAKDTLKIQDTYLPQLKRNQVEYSPREINAEPGAAIYKQQPVERDVLFKDSPIFLGDSEAYLSKQNDPVSSVASFPHIDSLQVTANHSYQALSDDGFQEPLEEFRDLPPKRVTSIGDFVKLLYSRDPAFVQQSLSRADCDYRTLQQLLYTLTSSAPPDTRDYPTESPRKRSLPSVSPRSMTPEARSWLMEKEVLESQTRKLQMEVSSLSTENKILRQRLDRAQVNMEDLEGRLANNQEEVDSVYLSLQQQQREAERHAHNERTEEYRHLQSQIERLSQENLDLKSEVSKFEKHLDAAEKASNQVRLSSEKAKTMEAYKMEIVTLREEVGKVKALLNQSEHHLREEEGRNRELSQQVVRLTEMKNLLQQQIDKGGGGTVSDKQIKSLEKRLKITEERLHQERADRANNLSEVEDKLLTENARLQAVEKELNRQLQREKDKNRNLDTKVKDGREEVERLRLALPFDESTLTADKSEEYDIPYSKHSNQRLENKKTPDYKYVMGQVEQQSGLTIGQEKEVICHLWSTREMTYQQLRHLQFTLQDLELPDNDISAGLKHLRDIKGQYESRLQQLEEKLSDSQSQLATYETTYKEQLNTLVRERHDSFARLKTTEDLLEALKGENEILKSNFPGTMGTRNTNARDSQMDDLKVKLKNLENELHHLQTRNQVLDGEMQTLRVQLEAKEKALEDALTEADLASSRLNNTDAMDRKQERIQKLQYEIQNLQTEIRVLSEKNSFMSEEKKRSDTDLSNCQRELGVLRSRQREGSAGDLADNKYVQSLQEELQQKEVQLSQSTRDLQTVEKELKQTRQTMYSEQAQIAHLQTQVDSLRDQVEQKNLILDSLDGNESDSQSHYSSLKETLESMSQELALLRAQNKTLQTEVNRERSRCEILKEEVSRTSVHSEPRDRTELELQIQQLEEERDRLQEELIETARSGEELTQSVIESQSETQKLQQDLSSEQAKLLHMSAQKGELEQHLEEIAEEHDALIQEKSQNEEDIVKLEGKLQELVQTLELETQRHHDDHQSLYSDTTPELRKMARELDSIRILLDAKAREMEMLQDKLSRQNMETEFLQRRVELLHSENQCNREDIARLTTELATKIKESSSLKEVNQILSRERGRIQRQREMEDKEKAREREHSEKYRKEVSEVIHKADVQKYQRECAELREQLQRVTVELETVRAQLSARDETVENLKQDKGAFYQEYDSMCRRLAEKDEKIEQLQQRYDRTVDNMKQEFSQQKHNLEQERTSAESDLDKAKDTINYLNEEIKQKDAQLVTFGRTLHVLEEASRKKHELEQQVETLEHDCSSVKQLMQSHQREIESHQSTIHRMQEVQAKLQVEKTRLADQLQEEKESSGREIELLRKSLSDMESLHEGEKAYLKENLSQTQSRLQAVETSLASAVEARDKYQMTNRMLEHSLEENRSKLQEESTCYRAAEKKTESLQSQLNDSRRERFLTEDKLSQCQTSLVKLEKELGAERERCQDLEERIQELEAVSATQQSTLRAKQEQVDVLQSEIGKLRQIIDGQKQQLGGKLKKSAQEFKQQLDLVEMEKDQLSKQNKQLTFDLEKARETIQTKNKDNLKLQEDILNLEEQIRERSSKLRKIEDNLKVEEEIQSKLASRYQEQEDEVKRMKNFLSKKAEEATDADKSMWQDMSKVIQDMSLKIAQHFEGAKERENQREQDLKQIKRYKKQVRDLESELSTERAVHSITRSSLQALEEDCLRLRKQFMASKRRDKSSPDKPSKSRMEAINEIIARSQTQAQNMLAAGGYFEETLRSITTPRGANNNYNDCSPDTSIASDFSFNSVSPVVMATYPSQAKSPRK